MQESRWLAQYLNNEDMYNLAEIHEDEGVLDEHFFDTYKEYSKYVKEHMLIVKFQD